MEIVASPDWSEGEKNESQMQARGAAYRPLRAKAARK